MDLTTCLYLADAEPWFSDPDRFGAMFGGFAGAGVGVLGGLIGTLAGVFAPRGKARGLVMGTMVFAASLGAMMLATGIVAVSTGQPYAIWYPFVLMGGVLTVVTTSLIPVVRRAYKGAEDRQLEAEGLRHG
ncbi:MAG: hypothetical protein CMJ83_18495 [Planctomycetes bacterium]|nr:hypothetical protein [Planctomycetota bacterium]